MELSFSTAQARRKPNANANANVQQVCSPSASPTAQARSNCDAQHRLKQQHLRLPTPDSMPQRKLRIVTPFYEATFDTRGAVATSWIIKKNKNSGH